MNKVRISFERCKECGYCVQFCAKQIIKIGDEINQKGYYPPALTTPDKCIACGLCARVCPEAAIEVVKDCDEQELG